MPCSSCGRSFLVEEGGICRACVALRRLSGELRFSPHSLVEAQLVATIIESCLRTVEVLRDLVHVAAENQEGGVWSGRGSEGLGLRSLGRSLTESERDRDRGDRETVPRPPPPPPARVPPVPAETAEVLRRRGAGGRGREMMERSLREEGDDEVDLIGAFEIEDTLGWDRLHLKPGRVVVAKVPLDEEEVEAFLFVTQVWDSNDGSQCASVTSLGGRDSAVSRKLTSKLKVLNTVHVCPMVACSTPGNFCAHLQKLEVFPQKRFDRSRLGHTGCRRWIALCQEHLNIDVTQVPPGAEASHGRGDGRGEERGEPVGRRLSALRRSRHSESLKEGVAADGRLGRGDARPEEREKEVSFMEGPILVDMEGVVGEGKRQRLGEDPPEEASRKVRPRERGGADLGSALADLKKDLQLSQELEAGAEEHSGSGVGKKARTSSSSAAEKVREGPKALERGLKAPPKSVQSLLSPEEQEPKGGSSRGKAPKRAARAELVAAAQAASGQSVSASGKRRRSKKHKDKLIEALRGALLGKKKKKKKKREKKEKTAGGGSPPSSGGGSSDGEDDSDEDESYGIASESSSEGRLNRKFKAPLKRRAQKKPGSVIELLLKQVAQHLQEVGTSQENLLTQGPRISTHWQIALRPKHGHQHPALRELYLLAGVIDQIRGGLLIQALDCLAARFMAAESAVTEGWAVSRHLEIMTPESEMITPAEVQLQARKHDALLARAQGKGGPPWQYHGRQWQPYGGRGSKGEKGEKGQKGGKGRGGKDKGKKGGKARDKGHEEADREKES